MRREILEIFRFCVKNKEAIGLIFTTLIGVFKIWPIIRTKYRRYVDLRNLRKRIGAELYTRDEILRATDFYVTPDCQSIDPSGGEDFRKVFAVRQSAFESLDKLFSSRTEQRYSILLADSGMGKTALLLNYYARHCKRRSPPFNIALVPLGYKHSDEVIKTMMNRDKTILFLDAFDEDTQAMQDHRQRLATILGLTEGFQHVLITCRTQFFEKDDEIPRETGIARFGVIAPGQSREYSFYKIYLSPFSDAQVERYLKQRFTFWHIRRRNAAREIASKIPDLTVRPMLLAHIQDVLDSHSDYQYSVQIYDAMIKAWLIRETPFVDPEKLREFSEAIALDIFTKRESRGSERIPPSEAMLMASRLAVPLKGWQLRTRSLLNRDADGNLKFAHRTIMEYLFIIAYMKAPNTVKKVEWTDQIKRFWWELVALPRDVGSYGTDPRNLWKAIDTADLKGLELLHLRPLWRPRAIPQNYSEEQLQQFIFGQCELNQTYLRWSHHSVRLLYSGSSPIRQGTTGEDEFVIDLATGLMWNSAPLGPISFLGALKHVQELNSSRWAGYSDWRLPTLHEAFSFLPDSVSGPRLEVEGKPYSIFKKWSNSLWTADSGPHHHPLQVNYDLEELAGDTRSQGWARAIRKIE
jgi:hypothetical protein